MMAKLVAPWPDFEGKPIHVGDTLRHPDGSTAVVQLDPARGEDGKWRAVYQDGLSLWLGNQIGNKGGAIVVAPSLVSAALDGELPPLPDAYGEIEVYHDGGRVTSVAGFTADQGRGYAIDYGNALGRTALARLAVSNEATPEPFILGNQYRTQGGRMVRFVGIANEGNSYETMFDQHGHHRYTRRDFGRGTGASWDDDCVPPLYASPRPRPDIDVAKRLRLIASKLGLADAIPADDAELWGAAFSVLGMIRAKVDELTLQDCSPCESMGFVDGEGEPCKACNGSGQRADSGRDAVRYRALRDQNIFAHVGSFSPYVVQGQTMRVLEGEELDKEVDAMAAQQGVKAGMA